MPGQASAAIAGRNADIIARVTFEPDDAGVLFATGNQNSGMSLFVQARRLIVDYNAFGDHTVLESADELPIGEVELELRMRRGAQMAGSLELLINGHTAGAVEVPLYMRMMSSIGPSIGFDHGSAVSPRYGAPYAYTGQLREIVVQSSPERFADVTDADARAENARQ